jgi:hypothetical protein
VENARGYDAIRVSKLFSVGLQYKIPQVTITSVGIASFDQGPTRKFFGTQSKYPFKLPSATRIHGCLGSTNEESLMGGSFLFSDPLVPVSPDDETDDAAMFFSQRANESLPTFPK